MSDVTIPADSAASIAFELRARAHHGGVTAGSGDLIRWANLLDPPPPSLRDEVADAITSRAGYGDKDDTWNKELAGTILAVVRRHVEALSHGIDSTGEDMVSRDEVLALLGGEGG